MAYLKKEKVDLQKEKEKVSQSKLARIYNEEIDRTSAYEILKGKIASAAAPEEDDEEEEDCVREEDIRQMM